MDGLVRAALNTDAAAVASLYIDASLTALGSAANREAIQSAAGGAHALWRPLHRPAAGQWLIVREGGDETVTGFASFGVVGSGVGHLYALYVTPRLWSAGIGSHLLAAAIDHLRAASITDVQLWVQVENDRARRFYERRGWIATGDERSNDRGTFVELAYSIG